MAQASSRRRNRTPRSRTARSPRRSATGAPRAGPVEERLRDEVTVADGIEGVLETPPNPSSSATRSGSIPSDDPARRRHRGATRPSAARSRTSGRCHERVPSHGPADGAPTARVVRVVDGCSRAGRHRRLRWPGARACAAARGRADHASQLPTGEKPQRRCNLIVAASTRVELRPALGGELGHPPFYGRVNVLVCPEILEGVARQLLTDLLQGLHQRARLRVGEDPRPQQTVDMCDRAFHVAAGKTLVECQARRERHKGVGGRGSHPVGPKRHPAPPWRADQVWMPRPNKRTNPSASS